MQRFLFLVFCSALLASCGPKTPNNQRQHIQASLDLVNITDDKLTVNLIAPTLTTETTTFNMPEIVPGTYSDSDFGNYVEGLKAYTESGEPLTVTKNGDNTWSISNAKTLYRLSYQINDTFDIEGEHDIFSPSGTNIVVGEQFMLNLHGVIGYFDGQQEIPYQLVIHRPTNMLASTSLTSVSSTNSTVEFPNPEAIDHFYASRYFQVIDNPIMYNKPNREVFQVGGVEVELSVYSPTGAVQASALKPNVEQMINAQKIYLGDVNATKKYSILLYLSTLSPEDAQGFGALEHHTSTVVVLPEGMPLDALNGAMTDVVSHEFFHILTPLAVHSREIHYFSYNEPVMSKHLWMYEGLTEYFAQHFQVQQGLVSNGEFYQTIVDKISNSQSYNDALSFTEMSANILEEPFASEYANVYEKGALIGMCLDILLRDESNGEKGILALMKDLSSKYGVDKPFDDNTIIDEIVAATSPRIKTFFDDHVIGNTPIPYEDYFAKAGLGYDTQRVPSGYFLDGNRPFINANQGTNELFIMPGIILNSFMIDLGLQGNDVIKSINDKEYNLLNVVELIQASQAWKEGEPVTFVVKRNEEEVTLKGSITTPMVEKPGIVELQYFADSPELRLRQSWLKGS